MTDAAAEESLKRLQAGRRWQQPCFASESAIEVGARVLVFELLLKGLDAGRPRLTYIFVKVTHLDASML